MIFSENRYTLFRIMREVRKKEAAELDARRPFSFSVDGGLVGGATLTRTATRSSKTGGPNRLDALQSLWKFCQLVF
jgi:hypothetical protein